MKTVIEIVKAHLVAEGFDGLVSEDSFCGCALDDLVPCGEDCSGCRGGYRHFDPRSLGGESWAMWGQKEPPTLDQWSTVEAEW